MAIIDFTARDIGALQSRITGYAVAPGDPRFDHGWLITQPEIVVRGEDEHLSSSFHLDASRLR